MRVRTALMIIGTTGAFFAAGLLLVIFVGRSLQALREGMSNEDARMTFVAKWQPPVDLKPELVFPPEVGGRRVVVAGSDPAPDHPAVGLPGLHGAYEKPGRSDIKVFAARANALEAEAIFRRARASFEGRSGATSVIEVPGRLRLTSSSPAETLEVWTVQGWLFVFRYPGELEAEFIRMYLASITARKP